MGLFHVEQSAGASRPQNLCSAEMFHVEHFLRASWVVSMEMLAEVFPSYSFSVAARQREGKIVPRGTISGLSS
jgi:hypothetical protein